MFKRLITLLLLAPSSLFVSSQTTGIKNLYRLVKDTYETKADTLTNAFIESFMIKNKGIFNVSYNHYANNAYWTQAHAIDVVVYAYQRYYGKRQALANQYKNYITAWYNNKANNYAGASTSDGTYRMFENPFTDDMCWITLTLMHIGEATGTNKYFVAAKNIFDRFIITRATEDEETGGLKLPWNTNGGDGPNACTQSPATLIAAKLYQKYGDAKYLEYAKKLYAFTSKKIVKSDGRVEEPPLTYTQGTFGEACRILYHVTDESTSVKNKYKNLAFTYLNYAFTSSRCTSGNNMLRDEGHNGDQSIFKAILIPYAVNFVLDEDMTATNRVSLYKLIVKNTNKMWENIDLSRYPIVFCNWDWTKPYTGTDADASMGAACCGASLMENSARMCQAIVDRYDLGTLYNQCKTFAAITGEEGGTAFSDFSAAMATAEQILENPGNYTTYKIRQAITKLETAYQNAQDFATDIASVQNSELKTSNEDSDIYDLSGRKATSQRKNLSRGIYIIGGRKVMVK